MHPPQKANVQWYICKYIDELKRNERAWILQLTNDIPDTQARCLVFFCQRSPFLLNLHPWSQSWSWFPRIFPLLDWWSTIYPMLPILHLIQLALHDSPCGEPYWVCIRIIACLFSPVFFPASSASHGVWMSIFFFQSLFCWIFVIFLWSLWEFGRLSIFLLIYLSAWVDLLEQWLCLIELIPPIELSPFPFLSLFSVVGHRLLVTSYLDSGADPLYSSVLEHMLRIVPAVLYFPPTLGLLYLMPQSNKWDKWARGAQYTWMVNE